ncbi:MAG: ATP-binding cassette domain-containing protein [Chthoniobacter sp.]|uniref:ATP-binding cassette domain-containing protein n=1 Tax=Chthoniobacter sp. TaxID=2510640 RepID=UPI0032AA5489
MAADPLWQLDAVSLDPARLREVSVAIPAGVTAVIGWSGAGKTSLLNLFAGFERPDRGAIHGAPRVAWVPQNGGLWPHCTGLEHLEIACGSRDGIETLLAAFDLAEKQAARPPQLSQGEQSRLAVARALATKADVLVMDEPLAHVDPARAGNYWRVIREHLARTGASLVFSTHTPESAVGEAQHALCLRAGRVLQAGPVAALYAEPPDEELMGYLGAGNWFTPTEARRWLRLQLATPRCLRPEQLAVAPADAGALRVEASHFRGACAEIELRHVPSNATRTFFHRPARDELRPGKFVQLTALLCFALLFFLTGCQRHASTAALTPRAWRTWQLPPEGASIPTPRSLAIGLGDEIATLDTAGRVLIYNADGALLRQWHMLDVKVGKPEGIVVLHDGRIVVCDTHYHRVVWFDRDGNWLKNIGQQGKENGEFIYPVGICKDTAENLYVCEYGGHDRIQKFSREGQWLASFGSFGTGPGQFQRPSGLTWLAGKVYITDAVNNRVLIFTDAGEYLGVLGTPGQPPLDFNLPYDIAAGGDGALYVIEYGSGRLTKVSTEGQLLGRFGHTGSGDGEFSTPWGLAIDSRLRLRIADTKNRRLVSLQL